MPTIDEIKPHAQVLMEECAQIADAESSCEGIAQRIADAIRAAAKDLK